ncbi:MAG: TIGR02646 family protein [Hahellaceae bacterium]|nr:TIGR02646 family protein [Hahellaceae bacterium]
MKTDTHFGGPVAYDACRMKLLADQGGICAFCEMGIHDNDPLKCRVEHFHPKSDITPAHNWALDWDNLLGVCAGGSYKYGTAPHTQEPLSQNLSCDAHKDQMIQSGKLSEQCEGWILNPLDIMANPSLFVIEKSTGRLLPDTAQCATLPAWPNNRHADLQALVQNTIDMLNLNCDRLSQARLALVRDIEHNKKKQREQGFSPQQGLSNLAAHYFRQHWPQFFTTIRICLGAYAESHLASIAFQG